MYCYAKHYPSLGDIWTINIHLYPYFVKIYHVTEPQTITLDHITHAFIFNITKCFRPLWGNVFIHRNYQTGSCNSSVVIIHRTACKIYSFKSSIISCSSAHQHHRFPLVAGHFSVWRTPQCIYCLLTIRALQWMQYIYISSSFWKCGKYP